jgi:DNA modification methylase
MPRIKCECGHEFEYREEDAVPVVASMVFTDPPYNVAYEGGMSATGQHHRDPIAHDNMSAEDFYKFLHDSIAPMMQYCDGVFYICMSGKELPSLKKAFEELGGHWQCFIVWVKNTFTLSRSDWQSQYEPILYGWNGKTTGHYFAGWRDEGNVWAGLEEIRPEYKDGKTYIKLGEYHLELDGEVKGRIVNKKNQLDVWLEKKPSKSPYHPTSKPVALCRKGIEASSHRASIVLDPFSGGGSTIMACQECGRIGYGIELDAKYVDATLRRMLKAYPHLPILCNGVEYDKGKLKTDAETF